MCTERVTPMDHTIHITRVLVCDDEDLFADLLQQKGEGEIFRNTEKDAEDLLDMMVDHHRDVEMGAAWPKCRCNEMCKSCYPRMLVKNGGKEEYFLHLVPQETYDALKELGKT